MNMRKIIITAAAVLFAVPAFAQDLTKDTVLGKSLDEVKANLTSMGYDVRKGEMEDGLIEVYFVKDNKTGEAYVDGVTGKIAKLSIK
jgi:hypothetical protein